MAARPVAGGCTGGHGSYGAALGLGSGGDACGEGRECGGGGGGGGGGADVVGVASTGGGGGIGSVRVGGSLSREGGTVCMLGSLVGSKTFLVGSKTPIVVPSRWVFLR